MVGESHGKFYYKIDLYIWFSNIINFDPYEYLSWASFIVYESEVRVLPCTSLFLSFDQ